MGTVVSGQFPFHIPSVLDPPGIVVMICFVLFMSLHFELYAFVVFIDPRNLYGFLDFVSNFLLLLKLYGIPVFNR